MPKVILDTNFILSCIRNNVDFYEEILLQGYHILIPREVIDEIIEISAGNKSLKFREEAKLALKLIKSQPHEEVNIYGKYVDDGLKKYLKENPDIVLATMDKELKKSVRNRKLVLRNKKKIELQ